MEEAGGREWEGTGGRKGGVEMTISKEKGWGGEVEEMEEDKKEEGGKGRNRRMK